MKKIELNRMQPIRDVIYQRIRKAILRGDFRPGERLIEEQLSRDLGTSRTPVREALRKLEVEKMVVHHPHKGVVITDVPANEMEDLYEIRAHVESIIAKRAALSACAEDIEQLNACLTRRKPPKTLKSFQTVSTNITTLWPRYRLAP